MTLVHMVQYLAVLLKVLVIFARLVIFVNKAPLNQQHVKKAPTIMEVGKQNVISVHQVIIVL